MYFPVILAHGALGWWDELVFLGVAVIFLTMMVISWVRSRAEAESDETLPGVNAPSEADTPDRFRLD
jgi:hypothetical protein